MSPLLILAIGVMILGFITTSKPKRLEKSDVPIVEPEIVVPKIKTKEITVEERNAYIESLYQLYGYRNNIDPMLIKAHACIESDQNSNAFNPSDPSYGIMQILCEPDGKGGCSNPLNVVGWPPTYAEFLYDPEYNIKIGAQIIAWNTVTYGYRKGVAVYNSRSARKDPYNGPFVNGEYVNKVIAKHNELRAGQGAGGEF